MESKFPENSFEGFLVGLVRLVAKEEMGLHDERSLLVTKEQLLKSIAPFYLDGREPKTLVDEGLFVPVESNTAGENLFHVVMCNESLDLIKKMEVARFPRSMQREFLTNYIPLSWALYADVDNEIEEEKREKNRPLTKYEIAFVRVISDFTVAQMRDRMEKDFLEGQFSEEEFRRLKSSIGKAVKRNAVFSVGERAIQEVARQVWTHPRQIYPGRGIKEFIGIAPADWTPAEKSLLWTGHFDLALCDERGSLSLVLEYQGLGHFGHTKEEERKVQDRDWTKLSICEKAGIPLLALTQDYAFQAKSQETLLRFLQFFVNHNSDAVAQSNIIERLIKIGPKLPSGNISAIRARQKLYKESNKFGLLASVIWDLHAQLGEDSKLLEILKS